MSYSAYVACNCYRNGKTTQPPYTDYLRFDGDQLFIDVPEEIWDKDERAAVDIKITFDAWKKTACEHTNMEYQYDYLADNTDMEAFRFVLEQLGGEATFPILSTCLPTANGGILPSEHARQAFDELALLEQTQATQTIACLTEQASGKEIAKVSADSYRVFYFSPDNLHCYGLNNEGFFILETVEEDGQPIPYIVFQSTHFTRETIGQDLYRFTDISSGESYDCSGRLSEGDTCTYQVVIREVSIPVEYDYMIAPLKRLTQASIDTGNPVHWL